MPILTENIVRCEQYTPQWWASRCGRITASRIQHVMAYLKSGKGEMACRKDYRLDIIAERLTGDVEDKFVSREMQWGTDHEPEARTAYEVERSVVVDRVGFAVHPELPFSGASPDSLIDDDGIIEIKCPKTTTHIGYLLDGIVPEQYQPQMLWQMACTGRKWADFISYDPRQTEEKLRLFIVRFVRHEQRIADMTAEVIRFNAEIDAEIDKLMTIGSIAK